MRQRNDTEERAGEPLKFRYDRGIGYEATILPPRSGLSFSLANFYTQEDADRNGELAAFIANFMHERGVRRVYAPSVASHSARIVPAKDLSTCIVLPGGVKLFRNKDLPADGTPIRPDEAWIMSGQGCPVLVATAKGVCIPMHASRDCFIDMQRVRTGKPSREHESVIAAALSYLVERSEVTPSQVGMRGYFNIDPKEFTHPFDHPTYGESNLQLFEDILEHLGPGIMSEPCGNLDLAQLGKVIGHQLRLGTVGFERKLRHYFATTRNRTGTGEPPRNLVIVHRFA